MYNAIINREKKSDDIVITNKIFTLSLLGASKLKNARKESKNSPKDERNLNKKPMEGNIVEVSP